MEYVNFARIFIMFSLPVLNGEKQTSVKIFLLGWFLFYIHLSILLHHTLALPWMTNFTITSRCRSKNTRPLLIRTVGNTPHPRRQGWNCPHIFSPIVLTIHLSFKTRRWENVSTGLVRDRATAYLHQVINCHPEHSIVGLWRMNLIDVRVGFKTMTSCSTWESSRISSAASFRTRAERTLRPRKTLHYRHFIRLMAPDPLTSSCLSCRPHF